MWRHSPHHTHARCGEISDFSTSFIWQNLKLLHMWNFLDLSIFITRGNLKFLHMTNFSPHILLLILATNIRYDMAFIQPVSTAPQEPQAKLVSSKSKGWLEHCRALLLSESACRFSFIKVAAWDYTWGHLHCILWGGADPGRRMARISFLRFLSQDDLRCVMRKTELSHLINFTEVVLLEDSSFGSCNLASSWDWAATAL